jgi:hypothetical protein
MFKIPRVIWLVLLVSPVALAAPVSDDAPAAPAPAADAPAPSDVPANAPGAPVPVDLSVPQKSTLSGGEMLRQGQNYRAQIAAITQQVQKQIEAAKKDQDIIRLNCLLDKLTQVKVNGTMMDQALQLLQECITRNDESAELHEYTRITIINQKAQVLRTEADACVGSETNYVGPTKVSVEAPVGLQDNVDQPAPAEPPIVVIDRPVPASPAGITP